MVAMTEPTSARMPALYLGHGAPPLLDDPVWSGQLRELAGTFARPTAILIVSAHWESAPLSLSASGPGTELVYRSEEHTSELQSQFHLVCRLLLEKKKKK